MALDVAYVLVTDGTEEDGEEYADTRRDVDNMMAQAAERDLGLPLDLVLAAVERIDSTDGRIPGLTVLFLETLRDVCLDNELDPDRRL